MKERHLRQILTIYPHHFNAARPHRTLAHLAPAQAETQPPPVINLADHRCAADRSSADLPASTRSQHDRNRSVKQQVNPEFYIRAPQGSLPMVPSTRWYQADTMASWR